MKKYDKPLTIKQLRNMKDKDIDFSDIPEITPEMWKKAKVVMPAAPTKQALSLRLDSDLLDYFKSYGRGYQTRINAVLRSYMENVKT